MKQIAALFVRSDSIYKTLPGVDCYDAERNALTWPGGCPGIFHPPCRTWGVLKHFAKLAPHEEHALGFWAVARCRMFGGVVEHPQGSTLFRECGCNPFGGLPDEWGGQLYQVDQWLWGHKAQKRSLLYVVVCRDIPSIPKRYGVPMYSVQGGVKGAAKGSGRKGISHKEREETPPDFALWLVELARRCGETGNPILS